MKNSEPHDCVQKSTIVVLPRHSALAATARLRGYAFEKTFRSIGDVFFSPLFSDGHVRRLGKERTLSSRLVNLLCASLAYAKRIYLLLTFRFVYKSDTTLIIMQEALPFIPAWLELSLIAIAGPGKIVVDLDDAYQEVYNGMSNRLLRMIFSGKLEKLWGRSNLIFAGSPILVEQVRPHVNPAVRVCYMPTVVDIDRYKKKIHSRVSGDKIILGWIGSPSTTKHVVDILPWLEKVALIQPIKLVLVGATEVKSNTLEITQFPWELETETKLVASFDIGIMPLNDTAFTKGKCGYKLIQYMASAVPVIASNVGVNRFIVCGGEELCGIVPECDADWSESVIILASDAELRFRLGMAGRRRVESKFCTKVVAQLIDNELRQLKRNKFALRANKTPGPLE